MTEIKLEIGCPHDSLSIEEGEHKMWKGNLDKIFWCTFCDLGIDPHRLVRSWMKQ